MTFDPRNPRGAARLSACRALSCRIVLSLSLAVGAFSAQAAPIEWTIGNAVMNDGTAVTGSFVYDSDANAYSNINIQTALGLFAFGGGGPSGLNAFTKTGDLTGTRILGLAFYQNLPTLPGTFANGIIFSQGCTTADCGGRINNPYKQTFVGAATYTGVAAPVPLPAALPLLAAGLAFLAFPWVLGRRRRTAA